MPTSTQNPLVIAVWVLGAVFSIPFLTLAFKAIMFFTKAILKLEKIDEIEKIVKRLRHNQNDNSFSMGLSLTVIESDINALQEHNGLPVRDYPDRRISGIDDRRQAS